MYITVLTMGRIWQCTFCFGLRIKSYNVFFSRIANMKQNFLSRLVERFVCTYDCQEMCIGVCTLCRCQIIAAFCTLYVSERFTIIMAA